MAGIGTAVKNWKDEELLQQGIGTPAYHEPAGSIGTAAQNQGIGTAAQNQGIGTAASKTATPYAQPAPALTAVKEAPKTTAGNLTAPKTIAPTVNPVQQYTPAAPQTHSLKVPSPPQA